MSSESSSSSAAAASSSAPAAAAPKVARTLAEMQADPRYIQGKALIKQKKYDEAIEFLGALVGVVTGADGDETSVAAGAVYVAYGDALLCKVEESADLFGEGVKKAEAAKEGRGEEEEEEDEEDDEDDEEEGASASASASGSAAACWSEGGEAEGDVERVQISVDVQEDLEVAWENLEAARVIYVKNEAEVGPKNLGEVYLRLGDLQRTNGNYVQAIDDYYKALRLYTQAVPEDDRNIADLHYLLATSYIFASADQTDKVVELKQQALEHFSKCTKVFEMKLAKAKAQAAEEAAASEAAASGSGKAPAPKPGDAASEAGKAAKDATEFAEILDELRETIEATAEEIRREQAAPGSTSAKAAVPVTTVGFDTASASSAAAAQGGAASIIGATADGSSAAASSAAAAQPAAVNVMAVKKKPKPAPAAAPAAAAVPAAGNGASSSENGGSGKPEPQQEAEAGKKRPLEGVQGPATEEGPAEAVVPQPVAKEARVE